MMKNLLKLEEGAQLLACIALLAMNAVPWWAYLLLALGPDIGMLGYLVGPRTGAFTYNLLHHKGMALLLAGVGLASEGLSLMMGTPALGQVFLIASIILYGHSRRQLPAHALGVDRRNEGRAIAHADPASRQLRQLHLEPASPAGTYCGSGCEAQ